MAHIPLLIATVYSGCSESTPPPSRAQNSNVPLLSMNSCKLLEYLDAIITIILAGSMYGSGKLCSYANDDEVWHTH